MRRSFADGVGVGCLMVAFIFSTIDPPLVQIAALIAIAIFIRELRDGKATP